MKQTDLIHKLKQLEGITPDERAYLINLVNTKKKYGLVWEDKPEDVEEQLRENLPVLKEVVEKRILGKALPKPNTDNQTLFYNQENQTNPVNHGSDNFPNHILIEGDNLHALTALTFTHEGKIDVIYIDPPYNTGENDFKYNDSYVDKENGFRHSMWLSFISKRFQIMKRLLSEKGVAIIHIDENEFDALSLLLETEVFSEKDCLGYIVWNKKNPKGDAKEVATMHEYIICFAKNKSEFLKQEKTLLRQKPNALEIIRKAKSLFNKLDKKVIPDEIKEVIKPFNYSKEILKDFEITYDLELINKEFQSWIERQSEFSEGEKAYMFIDENGEAFQTVSMAWPNKEVAPDDYFIPLRHPINNEPCPIPERGWRNPSSTMKKLLGEKNFISLSSGMIVKGEITFTINKKGENNQPRRKYLLKQNLLENTPSIFNYGSSDDSFFTSIGLDFPYAKPVGVAKYLISSIHPNPLIVLDFFAGSGTALHAILELNKDGKRRQGIIVTNNEVDEKTEKKLLKRGILKGSLEYEAEGICRKVTYPRISKLIEGYSTGGGENVDGLKNNNLRYYKSEFVNREPSLKNKKEITRLATELLCIKEDIYAEQITIGDYKLNTTYVRCFQQNNLYMMVIYDEDVIDQMVAVIENVVQADKIRKCHFKVYVFSNGQYPYTEEFEEVLPYITLCALPDAIYKAYQNVLPRRHRKAVPALEEPTAEELVNQLDNEAVDLFNQR